MPPALQSQFGNLVAHRVLAKKNSRCNCDYTSFFIDRGKRIEFFSVPCPQRQNSRSLVHVQIHEHLTGQQPIPLIHK